MKIEIETLKEYFNGGGATLETSTLNKAKHKKGYYVSIQGKEETTQDISKVNDYIQAHQQYIKDNDIKDVFIGLWQEKGLYYIDISILIVDKVEALETGKQNKQICIYDIEKNDYLYIKDYVFKKDYSVYRYNYYNNDIQILATFKNIEEVSKYLQKEKKNIQNKVIKNIDNIKDITKNIINHNMIICKNEYLEL